MALVKMFTADMLEDEQAELLYEFGICQTHEGLVLMLETILDKLVSVTVCGKEVITDGNINKALVQCLSNKNQTCPHH